MNNEFRINSSYYTRCFSIEYRHKKIHRLCYRWESIGLGIYLSSYNSLVVNVGIIVTFHLQFFLAFLLLLTFLICISQLSRGFLLKAAVFCSSHVAVSLLPSTIAFFFFLNFLLYPEIWSSLLFPVPRCQFYFIYFFFWFFYYLVFLSSVTFVFLRRSLCICKYLRDMIRKEKLLNCFYLLPNYSYQPL